jgi:hypothetical protein
MPSATSCLIDTGQIAITGQALGIRPAGSAAR